MSFKSDTKHDDNIVLQIRNVSKYFSKKSQPITRLIELLFPAFKRKQKDAGYRALDHISLDIKRGETVGIVGRNGAGKSTLLQIICGTLQPSTGSVVIEGRLAALLELGAGFNPDYTGRENAYLNGTILGMSKQEVADQFDAIEDFADIGTFIDQPVRNYSSGMFVRLAFAVAIHANPEILVVDEALSVGDEAFQRKCFGKIEDIQRRGGTILFVSHSASSVLQLCNRAIFLDKGQLVLEGAPKEVVTQYQRYLNLPADRAETLKQDLLHAGSLEVDVNLNLESEQDTRQEVNTIDTSLDRFDSDFLSQSAVEYEQLGACIRNPEIRNAAGEKVNVLTKGEIYNYSYEIELTKNAVEIDAGMMIKSTSGVEISGASSGGDVSHRLSKVTAGAVLKANFTFKCDLAPTIYFLNAGVMAKGDEGRIYLHRIMDIYMFRVDTDATHFSTGFVDLLTTSPDLRVQT